MQNLDPKKTEVAVKLKQLRKLLIAKHFDGIVLNQTQNTAWITAGAATYVNEAADGGPSSILVMPDHVLVITDSIERPRLEKEERLGDLGFEWAVKPWYSSADPAGAWTSGKQIAAEADLAAELRELRTSLQPIELDRARHLGKLAAAAMSDAARSVKPGDSEYAIAGKLAGAARSQGGSPIVTLIATDERIENYRHPLPTAKKLDRYALLALCMRREGLVVSITRLVYFGNLPDALRQKAHALARIDGRLIVGTQPGRTMSDLFALAKQAYADEGYPEAIEQHHQGGSAGYLAREVIATPGDQTPIKINQLYAWNPSVRGAKSEDTVALTEHGVEVLTQIPGWPVWETQVDGKMIVRPAILEM